MKKIMIAIPAYNEEKTIANVITKIPRIDNTKTSIVVVDDWSIDRTKEVALDLGANIVIRHHYNKGVWAGFASAIEYFFSTDYDILVTIDADWQFPAADIPMLIEPLIQHKADIAIASRYEGVEPINMPMHKYYLNRLISQLVSFMMGKKVGDLTCGFRAYSRNALYSISLFSPFTYTQEVIIDALSKRLRIARIPVQVSYFSDRKSRVVHSVISYINKSITIIIRTIRDARPVLFFGAPWILSILWGIGFGIVFVLKYLRTYQTTPNRTWFFLSWFLILFGFLLILLGLMSDMMKRNRKLSEDILKEIRALKYSDNNTLQIADAEIITQNNQ